MKKIPFFTYAVISFTALLYALPVAATELTQPLLAELTSPGAPLLRSTETTALLSAGYLNPADAAKSPPPTALFSLEELRSSTDTDSGLDLADIDLSVSDIPLTLNSKVEYFLYYFQTSGKQSFSKWLSRS